MKQRVGGKRHEGLQMLQEHLLPHTPVRAGVMHMYTNVCMAPSCILQGHLHLPLHMKPEAPLAQARSCKLRRCCLAFTCK